MTTGIISDALENAWLNHVLRNTAVMTALGWILAKGAGARVPYNVANRPTNGTTTRTSATTNNRDAYEVSHRVTHEADTRGEVEIEY